MDSVTVGMRGVTRRAAIRSLMTGASLIALSSTGWAADAPPAAAPPIPTPPPPPTVTIAVFGDSMADGLWGGLYRNNHSDKTLNLVRLGKNGTGLGHPSKYDWIKGTQEIITETKPDIAVVCLGLNDRVSMIMEPEQKSVLFGTPKWKAEYARRIDAMMGPLHAAKIPTFWVGLPIMRDDDWTKDAKMQNGLFEDAAKRNGITFLPMWDIAGGGDTYTPFGKDKDGHERQLRADDGAHYTDLGFNMLADHLLDALKPTISDIRTLDDIRSHPNEGASLAGSSAAAPATQTPANAAPASGSSASASSASSSSAVSTPVSSAASASSAAPVSPAASSASSATAP